MSTIRSRSPRPRASRSRTRRCQNPVQEGNLIFTDPPRHRQLRKLINSGFTRRQVAMLEPKVREIVTASSTRSTRLRDLRVRRGDRRAAADPDDRRDARRAARRLGAVPARGRTRRRANADPEIELDCVRRPRRAVRVLHQADRRAASRRSRRTTCCRCWPPPRSTASALTDDGPAELLVPAAGRGQRDHPQPHRARHAGADRSSRTSARKLRRRPVADPGAVEEMLRWTSPVTHMARHRDRRTSRSVAS